jgi:hypothetical protein
VVASWKILKVKAAPTGCDSAAVAEVLEKKTEQLDHNQLCSLSKGCS